MEIWKLMERIEVLVKSNEASNKSNEASNRSNEASNTLLKENNIELKENNEELKETREALIKSDKFLRESNKGLEERNETLIKSNEELKQSNEELKQRIESLVSDLDAAMKKLKTTELLLETEISNLAMASEWLDAALKRAESAELELKEALKKLKAVELSLTAKEALHIVQALDLRELCTTLRDAEMRDLNAHLPEGESEMMTFKQHLTYSEGGGKYAGDVTPRKVIKALDNVIYHFTEIGNRVAHEDRLMTKESKTAAYERVLQIVSDVSSPGTKTVVLQQVHNHLDARSLASRNSAHDNVKKIGSGRGNPRVRISDRV